MAIRHALTFSFVFAVQEWREIIIDPGFIISELINWWSMIQIINRGVYYANNEVGVYYLVSPCGRWDRSHIQPKICHVIINWGPTIQIINWGSIIRSTQPPITTQHPATTLQRARQPMWPGFIFNVHVTTQHSITTHHPMTTHWHTKVSHWNNKLRLYYSDN